MIGRTLSHYEVLEKIGEGGGFLVFRPANGGKPEAYDFRESAPAKAHAEMFLKDGEYDWILHHAHGPSVRKPIRGTYRDYDIISMPPPSSEGTVLVQLLNILEGFDL
jgi:gamma-glutamyltranspeptidase